MAVCIKCASEKIARPSAYKCAVCSQSLASYDIRCRNLSRGTGFVVAEPAYAGASWSQPRSCQVHKQTRLPSGSASTQKLGASASLTRAPPTASAASMRDWTCAGSTHTSGCQR
jgi:hypothetical protein